MERLHALRRRVGGLPSAWVVGGAYVAVTVAAIAFGRLAAEIGSGVAIALVAVYAFARRSRRRDVVNQALLPAIASNVVGGILGIPRPLVGYPLAAFVVVALAAADRAESRARSAAP